AHRAKHRAPADRLRNAWASATNCSTSFNVEHEVSHHRVLITVVRRASAVPRRARRALDPRASRVARRAPRAARAIIATPRPPDWRARVVATSNRGDGGAGRETLWLRFRKICESS